MWCGAAQESAIRVLLIPLLAPQLLQDDQDLLEHRGLPGAHAGEGCIMDCVVPVWLSQGPSACTEQSGAQSVD